MLTQQECDALREMRQKAADKPFHIAMEREASDDPARRKQLQESLDGRAVLLRGGLLAILSIELGHPVGPVRHLSLTNLLSKGTPSPEILWRVAEEVGFVEGLEACSTWAQDMEDDWHQAHVAQPINYRGDMPRMRRVEH